MPIWENNRFALSPINRLDAELAYTGLRLILGTNILMHGAARLLTGSAKFAAALAPMFAGTPLPAPLLHAFAFCLPWVEGILGVLILFGLFSRAAYLGGLVLMLVLTFGSCLHQDWQAAGIQLTYTLIYAILLALRGWNRFSIDSLLPSRR
jgi:thiosulfate dehydrogenase (quinone) large subunit